MTEKITVVEFGPKSNSIKREYKKRLQHVKTTCKGLEVKDQNDTVEDPRKYFFNIVDDNHRYEISLADLRGAPGMRALPLGPKSFIFMQFLGNF